MTSIELITIGDRAASTPGWADRHRTVPASVADLATALATTTAEAVLCLDPTFPPPSREVLDHLLDGPCDGWHGGLRLGLGGHPRSIGFIQPQWMLTTPTDPDRELTSPHVTFRALLVRRQVLDQLGGPDAEMESLTGAGLELGLRWTRAGALLRHVPVLAPPDAPLCDPPTDADDFRCAAKHFGRSWAGWALGRSILRRQVRPSSAVALGRAVNTATPAAGTHYTAPARPPGDIGRTVSVILPTIDRYSYLEAVLQQLAEQTVAPHEVLVVDQTPAERRRHDLTEIEPGLPLTVTTLDTPGQSTARNAALTRATGEFVLFIDDDDEIDHDLLERHLERLTPGIDAICGGVDDATAGPPPPGFRHRRASDVFPMGNSMLKRAALRFSGLSDPVFDRGPRADRDLGTRLHLAGAVLVYDPSVMVFHHHAPMGGLRTHGARAITRASVRDSLRHRNLPAMTEQYIGLRYYTADQRREARMIRILSTLSGGGGRSRRLARAVVQTCLLPSTLRSMRQTDRAARAAYASRPDIPTLPDPAVSGQDPPVHPLP